MDEPFNKDEAEEEEDKEEEEEDKEEEEEELACTISRVGGAVIVPL